MSACITSDKEIAALLKLAAAALDAPDDLDPDDRADLVADLDRAAKAIDERRGIPA